MTHYENYNQLSRCEKEGADYRIRFQERNSGILIMAPHGGCIEPGTTEIAHAAAGKEHSIYCFEGIKDRDNNTLHITSTHFDEPIGLKLAGKARSILALHGCKDDNPVIYLGGKDESLLKEIRNALGRNRDIGWRESPLSGTSPQQYLQPGSPGRGRTDGNLSGSSTSDVCRPQTRPQGTARRTLSQHHPGPQEGDGKLSGLCTRSLSGHDFLESCTSVGLRKSAEPVHNRRGYLIRH